MEKKRQSAGGHVAAATHFCKGFDAEGEDTSIPTTANALALDNPVLDNGPGESVLAQAHLDGPEPRKGWEDYYRPLT